jgi:hypothetical protein
MNTLFSKPTSTSFYLAPFMRKYGFITCRLWYNPQNGIEQHEAIEKAVVLAFKVLHLNSATLNRPHSLISVYKCKHNFYFKCYIITFRNRDSSVGITTGYRLDDRGVGIRVPVGLRIFFFFTSFRSALGSTQPPIQWLPGALSPRVKRPGRKADHSSPASAEVKKMWIYTSTPPYAFMA